MSFSGKYYLYNGHGDVVQIVDRNGNIKNRYDYDVWGNFLTKDETIENHFTYFGQTYDETTGLYYLRARYYDPTTGRFTQQDPAEDGYNWYVYGNQNPIVYADYTGESVTLVICGVVFTAKEIALIGGSIMAIGYLGSVVFRNAFNTAIEAGKNIREAIIYAKGKAKAPKPSSKLLDDDKVKTPDSHPDEFNKNKDGSYTHKKTKWKFKPDYSRHGGDHWDASPDGKTGNYINVNPDGTIR